MTTTQLNIFDELIVDNFAGGGGASTGIELATSRPVNIAINHDRDAILMHKTNHPYTKHYQASVWDINPREVCGGQKVALAWFSPDCKHFSKAKGGKPVEKKIRGLAWITLRWAGTVSPRVIILENVEEFQTWGPVRRGKPVKSKQGQTFRKFIAQLESLGYMVEFRELKACDYGTPTIRNRFFLIARCDGNPIVWPEPTRGAPNSPGVLAGKLEVWRTAADIINWSLPCPSIFDTASEIMGKYGVRAVRPLAENTMRRIARGIQKFVVDNPEPFVVPWTVTNTTNATGHRITEPIDTVRTGGGGGQMLVTPHLIQYHGETAPGEIRGQDVEHPILTLDAANRYGLVATFLSKYYAGGHTGCGNMPTEPLNTITTADHNALAAVSIVKMHGDNLGQDAREPLQTIAAGGTHFGEVRALLVKYYGAGTGQSLNAPLDTITSRDRFGLVTIHGTQYAVVDIGLRMLTPRELFAANGFPPDYVIDRDYLGNEYKKSKQVARCGNAVPPQFAEALVRANLPELCGGKIDTMAQLERQIAI